MTIIILSFGDKRYALANREIFLGRAGSGKKNLKKGVWKKVWRYYYSVHILKIIDLKKRESFSYIKLRQLKFVEKCVFLKVCRHLSPYFVPLKTYGLKRKKSF